MRLVAVVVLSLFCSTAFAQSAPTSSAAQSATTSAAETELEPSFAAEVERENRENFAAQERRPITDWSRLGSTFFALLFVVLLAYFSLGKVLPWLLRLSPVAQRNMTATPTRGVIEVVDRLPLDPKRAVVVLKVGESHFLVGMTEQQMTMLAKLDDADVKTLPATPTRPALFGGHFGKILTRRVSKTQTDGLFQEETDKEG
ncbi:MAG: flagellar biosynthetic protein FliO [Deltaproteobacteria bacterium]|nr:flagellar biosynthetic protein FliO [Deltaproteobacteria bacterium]